MFNIDDTIKLLPYSLNRQQKDSLYRNAMFALTKKHYENCDLYHNLLDNFNFNVYREHEVNEYPFLPVRLFKEYELRSIEEEKKFKTMTSSGTSGQKVSKIFLDRDTASNQTKVLTKITSDFLGTKRLPMLVIDSKKVVKNRQLFSARGAGILGFSMLGRDVTYALDDNMNLDIQVVEKFLDNHTGENIFVFGFTFMIWEYFYKALKERKIRLDLSKGIMLHGGGFKKLLDQAVSNDTYKECLKDVCNIEHVYNYYGMVEQTGSIFMECECGRLHTSIFSDIIIRNHKDFSICKTGETGLIQLISLLPGSYPGHSILSEDLGELTGEDDCPCGRLGKTFKIHGRIKNAEIRGCSDAYEKR